MPLSPSVPIPDAPHRLPANNFDFLRFFLASLVIFSHSFPLLRGDHAGEPLYEFSRHQWTLGDLAVNFFFVISGLLITHSYLHSRSLLDFFRKRLLRIYPGFIAAMLVCVLIVLPLASAHGIPHDPKEWLRILVRTVLLQNYRDWTAFPENPLPFMVNGSTWTIFYELICYALTALLATLPLLRHPRLLATLFFTLLAVHAWAWTTQHTLYFDWKNAFSFDPFHLLRFTVYYLAGTVFYLYRHTIPLTRNAALLATLALFLFTPIPAGLTVLLPLLGTYALFAFAFSPTLRLHHFARFGDFSYGIYLYGFPLQQLLVLHLGSQLHPLLLTLPSLALSLLAACASWHLIEKRFLKLKHPRPTEPKPSVEPATASAAL